MFARYREILALPGASAFFWWGLVARAQMGMTGLATFLLIQIEYGSYATAGAVLGVASIGNALVAPFMSRLVDEYGQSRVLHPPSRSRSPPAWGSSLPPWRTPPRGCCSAWRHSLRRPDRNRPCRARAGPTSSPTGTPQHRVLPRELARGGALHRRTRARHDPGNDRRLVASEHHRGRDDAGGRIRVPFLARHRTSRSQGRRWHRPAHDGARDRRLASPGRHQRPSSCPPASIPEPLQGSPAGHHSGTGHHHDRVRDSGSTLRLGRRLDRRLR